MCNVEDLVILYSVALVDDPINRDQLEDHYHPALCVKEKLARLLRDLYYLSEVSSDTVELLGLDATYVKNLQLAIRSIFYAQFPQGFDIVEFKIVDLQGNFRCRVRPIAF
jgi:hypothetical protein